MGKLDAWRSDMLRWMSKYDLVLCPESGRPAGLIGGTGRGGGEGAPGGDAPGAAPGAAPSAAPGDTAAAAPGRGGGGFAATYNHTGWPAGVVRAGSSPEGLPIGIHAIAQPWREDVLLAALGYIESQTGGWVRPPM
jgi:amidase